MKVLISGASGLIATELISQLKASGHTPIRLVRGKAAGVDEVAWNPERHDLNPASLDGIDAIVNLAGATTGKMPWTKKYREELISSRLDSTRTLVEAMSQMKKPPKVFVSGSASGFYGDAGNDSLDETSPKGTGFLSDLAARWEQEALRAPKSVRVVLVRTTMVLSRSKGALGRLLPLLKLNLGGRLGSGKQWWAWITVRDEARAIIHLINTQDALGAYNLTAPEPATASAVIKELAKALNRVTWLPVPAFALRLAFGEAADELLLGSQKMTATKLISTGFKFEHPTLKSACEWVVARN